MYVSISLLHRWRMGGCLLGATLLLEMFGARAGSAADSRGFRGKEGEVRMIKKKNLAHSFLSLLDGVLVFEGVSHTHICIHRNSSLLAKLEHDT